MTGSEAGAAEAARRAQEAEEERRAAYRASVAAGYKPSRHVGKNRGAPLRRRGFLRSRLGWLVAAVWVLAARTLYDFAVWLIVHLKEWIEESARVGR